MSFLVLCVLLGLCFGFTLDELQKIENFSTENYQRVKDTEYITRIVQEAVEVEAGKTIENLTLQEYKNYQLKFDPN
jgi:hypothetical protein